MRPFVADLVAHDGDLVDVWTFIPLDPEDDALEREDCFDEAFGGALMGMCLGAFGLEHLADALEVLGRWGDFQNALRPQPSPAAVRQAIAAWRASGRSFAPGQVRGVWVPTSVPLHRLESAYWTSRRPAPAAPAPAPAATRSYQRPGYRLRPRW